MKHNHQGSMHARWISACKPVSCKPIRVLSIRPWQGKRLLRLTQSFNPHDVAVFSCDPHSSTASTSSASSLTATSQMQTPPRYSRLLSRARQATHSMWQRSRSRRRRVDTVSGVDQQTGVFDQHFSIGLACTCQVLQRGSVDSRVISGQQVPG